MSEFWFWFMRPFAELAWVAFAVAIVVAGIFAWAFVSVTLDRLKRHRKGKPQTPTN